MKRPLPPVDEPIHRGRPRNAEPSTAVSTWLSAGTHDKLIRLANREDTSISALLRRLVLARLP